MQSHTRHRVLNALIIAALVLSSLGGVIGLPAAAPTATAAALFDHTTDPTGVTLVGSLQDELGCPGDWQPDCAETALAYDADDDVWTITADLPAGNWEYKVALNGGWDENYGAGAAPGGDNIALNLADAATVKFYYDHKSHWITDNRNSRIATAPGDFQSELGCPGDWLPDCLRSWLQDIDGDGVYTFATGALPAGDYQGKVAINESWDENYGAGGAAGGDNIPFSAADGATVTFSFDSATNVPTIVAENPQPIDWATMVQPPVRHPFQNQVMYFVMPDRFANGDPSNDTGGIAGGRMNHGFDPTDKGFYHGGDLRAGRQAGLSGRHGDHLHLDDAHVQEQPGPGEGDQASAGYHGYWILDFTQFDPHFGSNTELEAVINGAATRGIDIFFDIITNHTADIIAYQEGQYVYRNKTDYPYTDADGNVFDDLDYANSPDFPALDAETSFPYTPVFRNAGDENLKVPAWLNNPIYYHNRGDSVQRRELALRRFLRAGRPLHGAPGRGRGHDRHLQGLDQQLRHRGLPH
ncbi:MAG: alpha-amylase family glycosyl hydrolase [Caldilineaceae bacterium]